MHPIVYLPHGQGTNPERLTRIGLEDFVTNAQFTGNAGDNPGPGDNHGGTFVTWQRPGERLPTYMPDIQTWLPAMPTEELEKGRYWIGFNTATPPRPHDLLKANPYAGSPVQLGDGGQWLIPHARELPYNLIRNEDGEWEREMRPEFYNFMMTTIGWQRIFDEMEPGDAFPDDTLLAEFVEEALRLNYRLTPELISHLRLFSTGDHGTLAAALTACAHTGA